MGVCGWWWLCVCSCICERREGVIGESQKERERDVCDPTTYFTFKTSTMF